MLPKMSRSAIFGVLSKLQRFAIEAVDFGGVQLDFEDHSSAFSVTAGATAKFRNTPS